MTRFGVPKAVTGIFVKLENCPTCGEEHDHTFFRDIQEEEKKDYPSTVIRIANCRNEPDRKILQHRRGGEK